MAIAGTSIRLYFDHNGGAQLARDLRDAGYDVIPSDGVGNGTLEDDEHLRWATDRGRCLFTQDLDDFPVLAVEWTNTGRDHAGIIVALQPLRLPYGEVLHRLLRLLDAITADEVVNRLEWLDNRWSD